jgi:hypothetical protein
MDDDAAVATVGEHTATIADGPTLGGPTDAPRQAETTDEGRPLVAVLAAAAAVVIAILGVRSSLLGSEASAAWQQAVRQEVKRAAATVETIRYVYENEAPVALALATQTLLVEEYRRAAEGAEGEIREALLAEAGRAEQLVTLYRAGSLIAGDPKYELEGGGYSIVARVADVRNERPDLVALDPDALQRAGDAQTARAAAHVRAAIPAAITFLFAALANGFPRRRRPLLVVGSLTLVLSVIAGIAVEAGVLL